eukprot:1701344-Rhodomonas_salina.2
MHGLTSFDVPHCVRAFVFVGCVWRARADGSKLLYQDEFLAGDLEVLVGACSLAVRCLFRCMPAFLGLPMMGCSLHLHE